MDGFGTDTNVIVMAATNRADILDKALMRAGRFDRSIYVDLPELHERRQIFDVHLKKIKLDDNVDREFLAKQTPGFSGADIANVCNEAALIAARNNHTSVTKQDFLDAVDRIIGGLEKKNKAIKPSEKKSCLPRSRTCNDFMVGRTCFTTFKSNNCSKRTFIRCSLVSSGRKTAYNY
jgi:cell division protease FtsH